MAPTLPFIACCCIELSSARNAAASSSALYCSSSASFKRFFSVRSCAERSSRATTAASFSIATSLSAFRNDGTVFCSRSFRRLCNFSHSISFASSLEFNRLFCSSNSAFFFCKSFSCATKLPISFSESFEMLSDLLIPP
uniref:Uncharacterized protein n=1 Tax=Opuntia streptacantha TaxID=393608 RepID=A0A7C9F1Z5_OPUST